MAFERTTVGDIEILALLDGIGERGSITEEAFPDAPRAELLAYRERYPGVYGEHDGWRFRIRAWLIRHLGGVILMDTGIGPVGAPGVEWFGRAGKLHEVLRETGTPPDTIDTVVISHVHDDHIGGLVVFASGQDGTSAPVPAFPDSRHVLQRADWDWQRRTATENDEDAAIMRALLAPVGDAGLVDLIEGDVDLAEGIALHHAPGHTPGHQILRVSSQGRRAILTGDAFNHPAQLAHPDWPSGADAVPTQAASTRRAVIAEIASHPGTILVPTHFTEAFGEVKDVPDGLATWVPESS